MRIVYITFTRILSPQGDSIQVMKVCQEMARRGHSVLLLIPEIRRESISDLDAVWHHYGITQEFEIRLLSSPIWVLSYAALPRVLTAHLFALQAVRAALKTGVDLIYTRHLPTAVLAARIGIRTVYEIHEIFLGVTGRLMRLYLYFLAKGRGLHHFVILTKALRSDLISKFPSIFASAKLIVAPDGVDLERFRGLPNAQTARMRLGLNLGSDLVAGYAGNFYPGKGVGFIYELAKRCPEYLFLLMGGEPEDVARYGKLVKNDGLDNVVLTGFIPNAELPLYLAACDVLLLPNQRSTVKTALLLAHSAIEATWNRPYMR